MSETPFAPAPGRGPEELPNDLDILSNLSITPLGGDGAELTLSSLGLRSEIVESDIRNDGPATDQGTCSNTCPHTCKSCETRYNTCKGTCGSTCSVSCNGTCGRDTCPATTCGGFTCKKC